MTRRALMLVALITLLLTVAFTTQIAAQVAAQVAAATTADEAEPADDSRFSIETFLEVPILKAPAVSPDGKQVAYLWTRRDLEEDERLTQLWLADANKGTVRRLSFGEDRPGQLAWRPDGALSFVRAVDGSPQVWINPLDGSEPRPVTDLEGGVSSYWWSPDGKRLAVLAEGAEPEEPEEPEEPVDEAETEETEEAEECDSEIDEDRADWTVFDRLEQPDEYHQLWIVAVQDDGPDDPEVEVEPRQLTEAPLHPYHVAWSPDGQTIALTYNARFSSLVDEEQQVGLLDVASGELTAITPADRHSSLGAYSPDGRQLAYFTDRKAELRAYLNLKDVVLRDLETGQTRVLTQNTQLALGGTGSTPGAAPVWSKKGKHLFISAAEATTFDLYRIDVKKRELRKVTALDGNLGGWDIAAGKLAYIESARHLPGSLYLRPVDKDKPKLLASTNEAVAPYNLQPPLLLTLPGFEGGTVEGYLFLPLGQGTSDRLPAIIEMHGGPYSRYGNSWTTRYPWHVLAREGFAVFIANPRGGTGYGEEFLRGVYRNFGTDDYRDLMAAVDALVQQRTIDPERMGFTGYSYGGLMTNVVISRTDRFKAAVSIAGIYNYVSAMGQNNPQLFVDSYQQPWAGDLQRMWEHSPASRADQITTPTLIMHGMEDHPVDPRQSIELFSYLQLNGVPSRLVLYPGEGHGINKPSHMIDYQTRELEWFRHYLLGDEEAAGAEEPVPVEETVR